MSSILPERHTSPFRALAVALVLIFASALIPLSRTRVHQDPKPKSAGELITRRLTRAEAGPYTDRVRKHLDGLRAMGYIVQEPTVFQTGHNVPKVRTWLDRLLSVQADEFYTSDGVVVLTLLDSGDPNVAEWAIYANNTNTGTEVWGNQAVSTSAPESPWSWGEYISIPGVNARNQSGSVFDNLCSALSPELNAMPPEFCTNTWAGARSVLNNSFRNAFSGTGGATVWCIGFSLGYGVCLAGNFFGTFAASLIYESVYTGGICREWW
jgi:hypothetical protein